MAKSATHTGVSDPLIQAPIELPGGNVAVLTAQKLRVFSSEGNLLGQTQFSPALSPRQIGAIGLLDADHLGLLSADSAPAGQGASTYWVFKNSGQLEKAIHVGIGLCGQPWSDSQDHLDLRALSCGRGNVFKVSLTGEIGGVGFTGLDISMDAYSWEMEGGIRAFSSSNHLALLPMALNAQPVALPEQITNCGNARWIKLDGTHITGQCDGSRAWERFLRSVDTAGNFTTELRVEADERNRTISLNSSSGIRYFSKQGKLVWSDFQGVVKKSLNLCGTNCEPYRWTPLLDGRVLVVDEWGGVLLLDEHTPEFRLSATSLDEVEGKPVPYLIHEDRLFKISPSQVLSIHNDDIHLVDLQNWTVSELPFLSGYDPTLVGNAVIFSFLGNILSGDEIHTGKSVYSNSYSGNISRLFDLGNGQLVVLATLNGKYVAQFLNWDSGKMEVQASYELPFAYIYDLHPLSKSSFELIGSNGLPYFVDRKLGVIAKSFDGHPLRFFGVTQDLIFVGNTFVGDPDRPKPVVSFWDSEGRILSTYQGVSDDGYIDAVSAPNAEGDVALSERGPGYDGTYFTVLHSDGKVVFRVKKSVTTPDGWTRIPEADKIGALSDGRWLISTGLSGEMEIVDRNGTSQMKINDADDENGTFLELSDHRLLGRHRVSGSGLDFLLVDPAKGIN